MNKTKTFKTFIFILLVLTLISSVSAKNFIIYNSSDPTDAHFLVNGTTGYVGIGVNTPTSLLQIANDNWISAKNYAGTGTINMFKVNSANQIEVGAPLNIGSFEFTADSGLVTFVDMPVTSSASIGTSQSYVFKVDGENIFTVYSESDGAGGIQNKRIGIGTTTPTHALHVVGDVNITGTIYNNGTLLQDTDTWWNITGSNYLINSSNILELNETTLNATIDSRVSTSVTDVWVNESGDTMSGTLSMGDNNITSTKQITFTSNQVNIGSSSTISSGSNAISIGDSASSIQQDTISIGRLSGATGLNSIALGSAASASGSYAIAIGSIDADWAAFFGMTNASGQSSIAIGQLASSIADNGIAIGNSASSSGSYAIAMGYLSQATATNAIALGANTQNAVANSLKVGGDITSTYLNTSLTTGGAVDYSWNEYDMKGNFYLQNFTYMDIGGQGDMMIDMWIEGTPEWYGFGIDESDGNRFEFFHSPNSFDDDTLTINSSGAISIGNTLDMTSGKITNLANATAGQDAVTLSQLQSVNNSIQQDTDTNTWWNITGSNYLINSTNILELNETTLNATIDSRAPNTAYLLNQSVIIGTNTSIIYAPSDGVYNDPGKTGTEDYLLKLPIQNAEGYVQVWISGTNDKLYGSFEIFTSIYLDGAGTGTNGSALLNCQDCDISTVDWYTKDGYANIYIAGTGWSNPKFSLDKIKISGNSYNEDWTQGYVWSTVTGFPPVFSGYSQKYSSTATLKIWNEYNDGDGSGLDADKLEAKDGSYFVYGNTAYGVLSEALDNDYNNVTRTGFYTERIDSITQALNSPVPEDAPNTGSSYVLNMVYAPTSYNKQIGGSLFSNNLKLRTETNNVWSPWVDLLTSNFTGNTNFTGNHLQTGNLEITGNLSATNIITDGGYLDINSTEYIFDDYYTNKILGSTIFGSETGLGGIGYFDFVLGGGSFTIVQDYDAYTDYTSITSSQISFAGSEDKNFNINKEASNFNLDLGASSLDMDYMGLEYLRLVPIVKNTKDSLNITYGIYDTRAPPATISNDIFIGDVFFNRNVTMLDSLDMTSGKITNLANGTSSQDAVTLSQLQEINSSILDGDVVGPSSAADNAITRFDGVTGKLIQDSGVYIDDSNKVGIGTAAPLNTLDVAGGAVIGSALAGATTAPANSLMVEEDIYSKGIEVKHRQFWSTDFFYNNVYGTLPWITAAISTGTFSSTGWAIDADRLGVVRFLSHASNANSGYSLNIGTAALILGGSEKSHFIFSPTVTTGGKVRLGWQDSTTSADVVDGVWLEIVDNVIYGKIAQTTTGGENTTATNYTLTAGTAGSAGTWYNAYITINSDATEVLFELYDSPQTTLLWNDTLASTTNIPKTGWRYTGHGALGYIESPAEATEIIKLAYMDLEIDRVLDR